MAYGDGVPGTKTRDVLYEQMAGSPRASIRAGALLRLARVCRRAGRVPAALDAYRAQLATRKANADAIPNAGGAAASKELSRQLEIVDTLIYRTVKPVDRPFYSEGPRVADRITALYRNVDGGNRRPTAPQMSHLAELEVELKNALGEASKLLGRPIM